MPRNECGCAALDVLLQDGVYSLDRGANVGLGDPADETQEGAARGVGLWRVGGEITQIEVVEEEKIEKVEIGVGNGEEVGGVNVSKIGKCLDGRKGLEGFCLEININRCMATAYGVVFIEFLNYSGKYAGSVVATEEFDDLGLLTLNLKRAAHEADGLLACGFVFLVGEEVLIEETDRRAVDGGVVIAIDLNSTVEGGLGVFVATEFEIASTESLESDGGGGSLDELLKGVDAFGDAPALAEGVGEIEEEGAGEGSEFGGLLILDHGVFVASDGVIDGAKIGASGGGIALDADSTLGISDGFGGFAELEVCGGDVEVGVEIVGLDGEGAEVGLHCVACTREQLQGETVQVLGVEILGLELGGLAVALLGRVVITLFAVDITSAHVGDGESGIGFDGTFEFGEGIIRAAIGEELIGALDGDGRGFLGGAGTRFQRIGQLRLLILSSGLRLGLAPGGAAREGGGGDEAGGECCECPI